MAKQKSIRKKTKKRSSHPTELPKRKKRTPVDDGWIMPFNSAYPGQDEVDFMLEDEDEDTAVIFQYEAEDQDY